MLSMFNNEITRPLWGLHFIDVDESTSDFELEMPGVKRENVKIELENGHLSVVWKDRRGVERVTGRTVGRALGVEAKLEDGLLTLKLQRPEKQSTTVKWL